MENVSSFSFETRVEIFEIGQAAEDRPAPISSSRESVTCATTSVFLTRWTMCWYSADFVLQRRRQVGARGWSAGTSPKIIPVTNEIPTVNPERASPARRNGHVFVTDGRKLTSVSSITRPAAIRESSPIESSRRSISKLRNNLAAGLRQRESHSDLFLPRGGPGNQQIRDVGAGDQQHQADNPHQHQQGVGELLAQNTIVPSTPESSRSTCAGKSAWSPRGGARTLYPALHFQHLVHEGCKTGLGLLHRHARLIRP